MHQSETLFAVKTASDKKGGQSMAQKARDKIVAIADKMYERASASRRLKRGNGWDVLLGCECIVFFGKDHYATSANRLKKFGITASAYPSANNHHPFVFFRLSFSTRNGECEKARGKVFAFFEKQLFSLGVNYHVASVIDDKAAHAETFIYETYI